MLYADYIIVGLKRQRSDILNECSMTEELPHKRVCMTLVSMKFQP